MTATPFAFGPRIRSGSYNVIREFRTDITTSRNGKEQRRALRQTPRKRIEYQGAVSGDCLRGLDAAMLTGQRIQLVIPERVRFVTTSGVVAAGGTTIAADVPSWLVAGALVMLRDRGRMALKEVASIATGNLVTFTTGEAEAWPAGTTCLHPALTGYLDQEITGQLLSGRSRDVLETAIVFHADPGSGEMAEDDGTAAATLDSRELFLRRPDRLERSQITFSQGGAASVDYGSGRVAQFFPVGFTSKLWDVAYTSADFDCAEELRQLFARMRGAQGEFWMPTFAHDMLPGGNLSAASTLLTVLGTGIAANYSGSTLHKAIAVRLRDGTTICRKIVSIATSGGNSVITVSGAWGVSAAKAQIARISWLLLWRFETDILTTSWQSVKVAQMQFTLRMLEALSADV